MLPAAPTAALRAGALARLVFLSGAALAIALGWWAVPWGAFGLLAGAMLLAYAVRLELGERFAAAVGALTVGLDLVTLAYLLRLTGGGSSPLAALAYVWLFGAMVLHLRHGNGRVLPAFGLLALLALAAGGWGLPGWGPALAFHALGLGLVCVLGLELLGERSRNLLDPLTGVLHRRAGLELLGAKTRQGRGFTLAFVDLKGFKQVNDRYGHAVGDEVLHAVAGRLAGAVRQGDVVMRYGGDEFVVASELLALRPRLEVVFMSPMRTLAGPVTVQADIGEVKWLPGESLEELLAQADASMYRKKHKGRSQPGGRETTQERVG